jgi:hypothetical protein
MTVRSSGSEVNQEIVILLDSMLALVVASQSVEDNVESQIAEFFGGAGLTDQAIRTT